LLTLHKLARQWRAKIHRKIALAESGVILSTAAAASIVTFTTVPLSTLAPPPSPAAPLFGTSAAGGGGGELAAAHSASSPQSLPKDGATGSALLPSPSSATLWSNGGGGAQPGASQGSAHAAAAPATPATSPVVVRARPPVMSTAAGVKVGGLDGDVEMVDTPDRRSLLAALSTIRSTRHDEAAGLLPSAALPPRLYMAVGSVQWDGMAMRRGMALTEMSRPALADAAAASAGAPFGSPARAAGPGSSSLLKSASVTALSQGLGGTLTRPGLRTVPAYFRGLTAAAGSPPPTAGSGQLGSDGSRSLPPHTSGTGDGMWGAGDAVGTDGWADDPMPDYSAQVAPAVTFSQPGAVAVPHLDVPQHALATAASARAGATTSSASGLPTSSAHYSGTARSGAAGSGMAGTATARSKASLSISVAGGGGTGGGGGFTSGAGSTTGRSALPDGVPPGMSQLSPSSMRRAMAALTSPFGKPMPMVVTSVLRSSR